uniref:Peptidase C14 caspase domain-containing protein n=1 Tax=viral metagenome TaxID=1070528 RepID=A0A6C0IYR9_9ZZZZ
MVKKIFLFGSNYKGTDAELQACLSDCRSIRDFFKTHGYLVEEYLSEKTLSWTDLKPKLTAWIQSLRSGDAGVIYYSGHGFQLKDKSGDEKDGQDEAIYFSEKSYATDDGHSDSSSAGQARSQPLPSLRLLSFRKHGRSTLLSEGLGSGQGEHRLDQRLY